MNELRAEPEWDEEEWPPSWEVRLATHEDVPAIAIGLRELLIELGGSPRLPAPLEEAAHEIIDDEEQGAILVADNEGEIVGVLTISWQTAIRIPGRYGLIQEFWVQPEWRGRTIGGDLMVALLELATQHGVTRVEVGLPSESFSHLAATEAFYVNSGFTMIGMRMRRQLP